MRRSFTVALLLLVGCSERDTAVPPVASTTPTAANTVTTTEDALTGADIVEDFVRHLQREEGGKAVHLYWDCETFARRVYGADFDVLSSDDQTRTASEHERFMMSIYALPTAAATMKNLQVENVATTKTADSVRVTFDAHVGDPAQSKPILWLLHNADGNLKLIDMSNADDQVLLSELLRPAYKSTGLNPLEYVWGMTKELPAIEELMGSDR